ncbi:MAG: nucleotidyltransferase domain-containing protein [Clostridiales bacterium]|nr:nucleotidyltransferase domain-containing protein [Clostridiales bacterium]
MTVMDNVIKNMVAEFAKYPEITKAVLFGSRARGDNSERSDYDVAVYGELPQRNKTLLRYFCSEELPTLHKVDLIFMQEQPQSTFTDNIEKDGITIYENA